uniref:interleukin-27 subunit beta n=1 Tax=Jaculus jaculus TaxID=51337 RepID=UPI00033346FD|nr:interleukin-27 subunit beta [Jaculus jaculus]
MTLRLILALALWAGCSPCSEGKVALSLPKVQCQAPRYPMAVDCSWKLPSAPDPTRTTFFIASYSLGMSAPRDSRPCLQPSPAAARCSITGLRLFSAEPYVLNVTAVRPGGASSSFLPFVAENIIKPDPPGAVELRPLPGQRLQVQWQPPRSWPFPDLFSLKYRIRYKRHGATRFRQVGPMEAMSFTFRAVRPHAKYCVQVSAQDFMDYGEASDWSLPAITLSKQ